MDGNAIAVDQTRIGGSAMDTEHGINIAGLENAMFRSPLTLYGSYRWLRKVDGPRLEAILEQYSIYRYI